ncbi:type I-E CRISPR-associated protein Cas5/CasD [Reinekea sp. G2M2-21]|uniref:type I-E CRISPR-associated protein Cas5/CasD n=1 Tax=Reinekea sp. G2M2-21 TaxID=2788942 RepID=UPI0018AA0CA9|nr:type I-E CRISPR-associated protein Cas5/CasD [Reinekea sp. G2M2-21]
MKEYLVFRLYGAMASWGQAAVGGDRPTGLQPTRSALLGLLGAALGIKRDDEEALLTLQNSVRFGVKQCVPTTLVRDYHTTQVPSHSKKRVHRTRASELREEKLNTILSSRDYRCDGLWVVSVALTETAHYSLEQLKSALLNPVYALSLGRKSCPPSLPLMPTIAEFSGLKSALDHCFPALTRSDKEDALWLHKSNQATYFWEGDAAEIDCERTLTFQPWDEPISRSRWQFKQSTLHQVTMEEG